MVKDTWVHDFGAKIQRICASDELLAKKTKLRSMKKFTVLHCSWLILFIFFFWELLRCPNELKLCTGITLSSTFDHKTIMEFLNFLVLYLNLLFTRCRWARKPNWIFEGKRIIRYDPFTSLLGHIWKTHGPYDGPPPRAWWSLLSELLMNLLTKFILFKKNSTNVSYAKQQCQSN